MRTEAILILFLLFSSPGILILLALFYDHRRNPQLALKYTIGFIAFVVIGLLLLFNYYMTLIIAVPIIIWGYFFFMFYDSKMRKKKFEDNDVID